MSSVSPYGSILWATISITACVQQMVPETRAVYRKAPSRGMRYLVNITTIFLVATRNTSSPTRTHTLSNKDAQGKEGTTHPPMDLWLTCRRLAWSF